MFTLSGAWMAYCMWLMLAIHLDDIVHLCTISAQMTKHHVVIVWPWQGVTVKVRWQAWGPSLGPGYYHNWTSSCEHGDRATEEGTAPLFNGFDASIALKWLNSQDLSYLQSWLMTYSANSQQLQCMEQALILSPLHTCFLTLWCTCKSNVRKGSKKLYQEDNPFLLEAAKRYSSSYPNPQRCCQTKMYLAMLIPQWPYPSVTSICYNWYVSLWQNVSVSCAHRWMCLWVSM